MRSYTGSIILPLSVLLTKLDPVHVSPDGGSPIRARGVCRCSLRLLQAFWALILLGAGIPGLHAISQKEQLVFLEEILFQKKLMANGSYVVRWNRQPTLSVMSGKPREIAALERALDALDRPLRPTGYRILRGEDGEAEADILVYHLRYEQLPGLLEELGLGPRFAQLNRAHGFFNEDGSLEKVYLFLDDRLASTPGDLQRRTLKLLLAALGMPGETRLPVRSIFFEVPPLGIAEEIPTDLSPIDVRAIRLLYAYLEAGDSIEAMRLTFNRQWGRLR